MKNIIFSTLLLLMHIQAFCQFKMYQMPRSFPAFCDKYTKPDGEPTTYKDFFYLGIQESKGNNTGKAVKYFKKAIKVDPQCADTAYFLMGLDRTDRLVIPSGSTGDNISSKYFDKAIKANPFFIDAYYYSGVAKYKIGRYGLAAVHLSKVIEYNKGPVAAAYYWRGNCKIAPTISKDKAGACADWQKALSMGETYLQPIIDKFCN